jgi:hypothetical protein
MVILLSVMGIIVLALIKARVVNMSTGTLINAKNSAESRNKNKTPQY